MTNSSPGTLSFDLTLRHRSCDPSSITAALGVPPTYSWAAGGAEPTAHDGMYWHKEISRGSGQEGLDAGLRTITGILQEHEEWCRRFTASGGEFDVSITYDLDPDAIPGREADGSAQSRSLVFDLKLYPEFTAALSTVGAGLQLRVFAQEIA